MRIGVWCSRTESSISCLLAAGDGGGTMCISQPKPTTVIRTRIRPLHTNNCIDEGVDPEGRKSPAVG